MTGALLVGGYVLLSVLLLWAAVRLERRVSTSARQTERLRRYGQRFVSALEAGDMRSAEVELSRWFRTAGQYGRTAPATRNRPA